jgi:hypothetical protein
MSDQSWIGTGVLEQWVIIPQDNDQTTYRIVDLSILLTAVSSNVLSSGSTFPPGKDVSPAYVRIVAERLSCTNQSACGHLFNMGNRRNHESQ